MGNTPEQDHLEMADAIVRTLVALGEAVRHLPIPVLLPRPKAEMDASEIIEPVKKLRTMLEEEPGISEAVINRLDQAALGLLTAIDLTAASLTNGTEWRYDAVQMIGTISILAARLAENELCNPPKKK